MKKIYFIIFLISLAFTIPTIVNASAWSCNSYYAAPYTTRFYSYYYYLIDSGNLTATYVLNDCDWDTHAKYGGLYKGVIGNSTEISGHLLGAGCSDGTCDDTQTDAWSGVQGELYFSVVYDAHDTDIVYQFRDFFTGSSVSSGEYQDDEPSDHWSVLYFWWGEGDRTIATDAFSYEGDQSPFEEAFRDRIPFVYYYDIRDLFTSLSDDFTYSSVSINGLSNNASISDLSIGIPSAALDWWTQTHAPVEFKIVSQSIIYKIIPPDTFNYIRNGIKVLLWVLIAFLLIRQIKNLISSE